jgi:hypothetical protein
MIRIRREQMAAKGRMAWLMVLGRIAKVIVLLGVGMVLGVLVARPRIGDHSGPTQPKSTGQVQIWTCSMHPQIRLPKPGLCPICNMELIPLETSQADQRTDLAELTVSEVAARLMDIEVAPVQRRPVSIQIRMVGKVEYDQTRLAIISARMTTQGSRCVRVTTWWSCTARNC